MIILFRTVYTVCIINGINECIDADRDDEQEKESLGQI